LFNYWKPDLSEFSNCKELKKLQMYFPDIESLKGLSDHSNLSEIEFENCKKLVSLDGIGKGNINLHRILLANCKRLKNLAALSKLLIYLNFVFIRYRR
jgi:hypothetical protein